MKAQSLTRRGFIGAIAAAALLKKKSFACGGVVHLRDPYIVGSNADICFVESRKLTNEEIAQIFNVPVHMVTWPEDWR